MNITETVKDSYSKGWFSIDGIMTQQSLNIVDAFKALFLEKRPGKILEIGSQSGGLTLCLGHILNELNMNNVEIESYDVKDIAGKDYITQKFNNIKFKIENLFSDSYLELNATKEQYIKDYFNYEKPILVLCDGGSKKNEFNILSKFLRPGDVIMAHDYSPNHQYFTEVTKPSGVWQWHEICDNDVSGCMEAFNLSFYMHEVFKNAAWLCTIKN